MILEKFDRVILRSDVEVILVNNGSTDNTQVELDRLLPNYLFARTIKVEVNQGYGFGILSGLNAAVGEYIGWTHADLQTDPADPLKALAIIEAQKCPRNIYIKGNRHGRSLFDQIFTWGMSAFESMYLGATLWDINAQPNIFHRSFFTRWPDPPHDFSLDLYAFYMARHLNFEVVRMDVMFPPRIHGQSSWNTGLAAKWKFIRRTVEYSVRLKSKIKSNT